MILLKPDREDRHHSTQRRGCCQEHSAKEIAMMWGWGNGWGDAGGAVMLVVMLAVLALIVVGIVLLARGLTRHDHYQPGPSPHTPPVGPLPKSALQVLEERYARGEIQREEFLQRKQDLLGG
jgi:putative membrane protein